VTKLSNEIVLRPRFSLKLDHSSDEIKLLFNQAKSEQVAFKISCVDDHIFIKLPKNQQHFWSPQLHLEFEEAEKNSCSIKGFFGPNPTIWTMFIFLHVGVGILFMINATWMYSNYSLGNPLDIQIWIFIVLILIWVLLYVAGTVGKKKGRPDMQELYYFMMTILPSQTALQP
tara:strand:+ start:1228 stop:1743 length:516 start_codon:yes stop_codon:yes gene_type:complete